MRRANASSLVDASLLRKTVFYAANDLPHSADARQALLTTVMTMTNMASTARCDVNNMTLGALIQVMASSSNASELLQAWRCWHDTARPMRPLRPLCSKFVALANGGAADNGYADEGEFWRSLYDIPASQFEPLLEPLIQDLKPLYLELHAFVRSKLVDFYGPTIVDKKAPIPAHLPGNIWAQNWINLYDIIPGMIPYPSVPGLV
jgi:peptidyl-dipeptidase A